ncbi:hypothetical protein [Actinomadura chokoriensis]|uniref:Uncharacterized protein n=1 Tax=Actinomadura chokoriensis TaxID=454156 RepID=A0ABV4R2S0_9ACTN
MSGSVAVPGQFGPRAAQRWRRAAVAAVVVVCLTAYAFLVPTILLFGLLPLAPLAPTLLGRLFAGVGPPTEVTRDGIRGHVVSSFQPRRELLPWTAIARVDVQERGRRTFATLVLTDGNRVLLRHPSGRRGDRRVHDAVAFMRQQHLAACGQTPPLVDRVPLPWRRVRVWVRVLAGALPVASLVGLAAWMTAQADWIRAPDDVAACEQVPRQVAARILPEGRVQGYGNRAACRWSTAETWKDGTWIDFHIASWPASDSERSYQGTLKATRAAGRTPHPLRNRDGDAYTVAWQDAWGFTAQGRAHVKGYLVMVALHSRRAASADEAERQAGDVLRALMEKLAARA